MSAPLVFIDGDQGTTGLQIHERLRDRTDITLFTLPAADRKNARRRAEAINACDIAILCLPDAAAREAVDAIVNPAVRVIDASSAHRTQPGWTLRLRGNDAGTRRAHRERRSRHQSRLLSDGGNRIASSAVAGWAHTRQLPHQHSCSVRLLRTRSCRRRATRGTRCRRRASVPVYGLALAHKHTPEIQTHAGLAQRPIFVPAYGAFRQGIVLTVPLQLRLLGPDVDGAEVARMPRTTLCGRSARPCFAAA